MLQQYEKMAKNLIVKHIGKRYLNVDNIDYVTRDLLASTFKYDETKGANLNTYLYKRAYFSCMKILEENKNSNHFINFTSLSPASLNEDKYSFESSIPDRKYINYNVVDLILDSKFLSNEDADILHMIYVEGKSQADCAVKYNISRQAISQKLEKLLLTLRVCYKSREHVLNIVEN